MVDMDYPKVPQSVIQSTEFTLNVSDPNKHVVEYRLVKNQTLSEECKKLRDKVLQQDKIDGNTDRIDANVFVFYIDHLSRAHFMRNFPKTIDYLSKFVRPDGEDAELFQFFRHHSVNFNSGYNNAAMYYDEIGEVKPESEFVGEYYTRNGYITGLFAGLCQTHITYLSDINRTRANRYDHLAGQIACDSNYDFPWRPDGSKDKPASHKATIRGETSIFRHCFYGQNMIDITFGYIKQFWAAYPENRKFFRTHISDSHEHYGHLIKYMDGQTLDLLQHFEKMGYLKDTIIIFQADHGPHFTTYDFNYLPDNSKNIENVLPNSMILAPSSLDSLNLDTLRQNEQAFIGHHDLYATLRTIAEGKIYHSDKVDSYAYISEIVPGNRDCSNQTVYMGQ